MKIPHYIVKNHNGIYYFRCRVTFRLKNYFPTNKNEIRKSLKTRLWSEAVNKARRMWVVMNNYIEELESLGQSIEDHEKGVQLLIELDKLNDQSHASYNSTSLDERIRQLSDNDKQLMDNAWESYTQISQKEYSQPDQKTLNQILELIKQQQAVGFEHTVASENKDKNMVDLVDEFINNKGDIRGSSIRSYRGHLADFLEISGVKTLEELSAEKIRLFKNSFSQLPPNRKKSPQYKGLKFEQILQMDYEKKVSRETCKSVFSAATSFFIWLKEQQYIVEDYKAILKAQGKKKKLDENRAVYENTDLAKLFGVEEYQNHGFSKYPHRYWVPLIALYTGMRLNEICQLHVVDVYKDENVWVFNVNDDGDKLLKTSSARRVIPIHTKLIELGFIEFYKSKLENVRLFDELTIDPDGKYYRKASRFFNESYKGKRGLLEWSGVERDTPKGKRDFHSFRHTFINCAKQLNINRAVVKEIVGHAKSDMTDDVYGKGYPLSTKKKNINKLVFEFKHPPKWR